MNRELGRMPVNTTKKDIVVTDKRIDYDSVDVSDSRPARRQALKKELIELRLEDRRKFSGAAWRSVKHRLNRTHIHSLAIKVEAMKSLLAHLEQMSNRMRHA